MVCKTLEELGIGHFHLEYNPEEECETSNCLYQVVDVDLTMTPRRGRGGPRGGRAGAAWGAGVGVWSGVWSGPRWGEAGACAHTHRALERLRAEVVFQKARDVQHMAC